MKNQEGMQNFCLAQLHFGVSRGLEGLELGTLYRFRYISLQTDNFFVPKTRCEPGRVGFFQLYISAELLLFAAG